MVVSENEAGFCFWSILPIFSGLRWVPSVPNKWHGDANAPGTPCQFPVLRLNFRQTYRLFSAARTFPQPLTWLPLARVPPYSFRFPRSDKLIYIPYRHRGRFRPLQRFTRLDTIKAVLNTRFHWGGHVIEVRAEFVSWNPDADAHADSGRSGPSSYPVIPGFKIPVNEPLIAVVCIPCTQTRSVQYLRVSAEYRPAQLLEGLAEVVVTANPLWL